jgi:putative chitinase
MCIKSAVGSGCTNAHDDVKIVQILLNLNKANPPLDTDGGYGKNTGNAINAFQAQSGQANPDGRIDPGGGTLKQLKAGLPAGWSADKLAAIVPNATKDKIALFAAPVLQQMQDAGITTPLQQAHFLAQIAHESGELRYTEEIASGDAYEGRKDLGNTQPGDGRRFKGRGLIQLTGRANYQAFTNDTSVDVVANPGQVSSDPSLAVRVSCWFWTKHKLNDLAVGDDVTAITKVINGGTRGLAERQGFFDRAKFFLVA